LDGWSVQYISANPGATTTSQVTPLTGSLASGGLYLIGEAAGSGGTTGLPPTQASGSISMSATAATVALVDNSTPLICKTAADCAADADIVDLVGYGTAVIHEGTADAPGLSNTTSAQRSAPADTDQNGADFTAAEPTPAALTGGGGGGGDGTPGPLAIHDIQGTSFLSPQDDKTVTNVPGIVTAVRAVGSSKGYWIQDPNPDGNPATSEGLFVFTGGAPAVAPGDSVLVSGKAQDFYPLSRLRVLRSSGLARR
jgi:predicted extracellular nuclease